MRAATRFSQRSGEARAFGRAGLGTPPRKAMIGVESVPTSAVFTSDFQEAFARQTDKLLRQRFLLFTGLMGGLAILGMVFVVIVSLIPGGFGGAIRSMFPNQGSTIAFAGISVVWIAMYVVGFVLALRNRLSASVLPRATVALLLLDGVMGVVARASGLPGWGFSGPYYMVTHVIACILLPITPRQAIWPVAWVCLASAVSRLVIEPGAWVPSLVAIVFSPLVGVPGTLIAWIRHSRRLKDFTAQFFYHRYGEMRRELVDARKLHESLFPQAITAGPVRVTYQYEPMRQIGGDFLYVFRTPADDGIGVVTSVVLLDVTGHGIPAALTVNRLHGELERVFAEDPGSDPGRVLRLLNRYVYLTLSHHSVYVTALCLRVDPTRSRLEYASGGHPPAFLRAVDGSLDELHSTSLVLGAAADVDFDPCPEERRFGPGDSVIAYTDGAIEARDQNGRMLKIAGLQRLLASSGTTPSGAWAMAVLDGVGRFRFGPPADDTLVVEIHRPIRSDTTMLRAESMRVEEHEARPAESSQAGRARAGARL